MSRKWIGAAGLACALALVLPARSSGSPGPAALADHVADEILVRFRPGTSRAGIDRLHARRGARVLGEVADLGLQRVKLPPGRGVAEMADLYAADPGCEYAEPNYIGRGGLFFPDDTFFGDEWHLANSGQTGGSSDADIDAPEGWGITRGSASVRVAVLDTGIDSDHPEFAGRILPGYDFVNEDADPEADHPHGPQVTGILAANADNQFAVAGVDHFAGIVPVKVLNDTNSGTTFDLVQGLLFAKDRADVINLSLINYPTGSISLNDALQQARDAGAVLIACAGNAGIGDADVSGPGASPLTLSVGATTDADSRASFSGTGAALDVVAPGAAIETVAWDTSQNTTTLFSGCSAATPVVSGIASLLLAQDPTLGHDDVVAILTSTAEDQVGPPSEDTPGRDDFFGYGRVNLAAAVALGCGDGLRTESEGCDDGNTVSGDGCSSTCFPEACATLAAADVPQPLPDLGSASSTLSVPLQGPLTDVDVVQLTAQHSYTGDLAFQLISPSGTDVRVIDQVCGASDDFDLGLDDEAAGAILCPPSQGRIDRPDGSLSAFDGEEASGVWTLQVSDLAAGDTGQLDGWGLRVCTPAGCGNAWLEHGEGCDDGNSVSGDGCSASCQLEVCPVVASTEVPQPVPDPGFASSALVFATPGRVSDVDLVDLVGSHPAVGDLDFDLVSPSGTRATLLSQRCGGDPGYDLDLDDEAASAVPCPPTDGLPHLPEAPLASFDAEPAEGIWRLQVFDVAAGASGSLDGWSARVCVEPCQIVAAGDVPLAIPDQASVTSSLTVPVSGPVRDVNVLGLRGSHTFVGDLDFDLISPAGTQVRLIDQVCGGERDFDLSLDDAAASAIPCPPTDGLAHTPHQPLAAFESEPAAGTWTLRVTDNFSTDAGQLDAWALEVCFGGCGDGILDAGEECDDGNLLELDGCTARCRVDSRLPFLGVAEGGSISFLLEGEPVVVGTLAGETAAEVAANVAAAIGASANLQLLAVVAAADGAVVRSNGEFSALVIDDPGLVPGVPALAPGGALLLALLLAAASRSASRRRP